MLWVRCSFIHLKYSLRKEKADSGYPLPANEMCGQKRCTLSKALQRNRISILEAFQSNNFCNGFYCLTPKDEFHHLQTNYFSWQLLSLLRSHMYKQL